MNLNDITLGELKEINSMLNHQKNENSIDYPIGEYVIVRTRNEGINFGKLKQASSEGCVISDARRIYYHKPKNKSTAWYEGVAKSGVSDDSKLSTTVKVKYIIEDYSLTICTKEAIESLRNHKDHETSV